MKKLMVVLLAIMLCLPAWAEPEDALLGSFAVQIPDGVVTEAGAGGASQVFLHENGTTRVVAMTVSRVPDLEGDHAAELRQLMAQFAPLAQSAVPMELPAGFYGLKAVTPGALDGLSGARVDQVTFMVLWQTALRGELLIFAGYDTAGDTAMAESFIQELLACTTVNDAPVMPMPTME